MKVTEGTKTIKNQDQIDRLRFSPRCFYHYLIHPTHLKRFLFFLFLDLAIIVFSLYLSFFIRFEFTIPSEYRALLLDVIPIFLLVKLTSFYYFKVYKITWGYVGINDLINIAIAQIASISMLMILILIPWQTAFNPYIPDFFSFDMCIPGFPRSVFLIDGMVSLGLFCGLRFSKRLFLEIIHKRASTHTGKKTLIIGAGNTGDMIVRDMQRQGYRDYYPIGMLDNNKNKVGACIHGLKVLGTTDKLSDVVSQYKVEAIIIAIPSLNYKDLRRIHTLAKSLKVETIKIVPRIYDFHAPSINIKSLEDIRTEDLLGRQVVEIDSKEIHAFLKHKIILITGAGGSIGSETAIQVCSFQPEKVILLDIDETELHNVNHRLKRLYPNLFNSTLLTSRTQDKVVLITGDIRDVGVVDEVFEKFKPHIVFHAAAYKHVPMMEINCKEAVKVNMFGTYNLVKASTDYHVEKFILISTDKAVRPTSIMGATKRMAEYICTAFNDASGTSFVSVRFGNVLGSRGSVVPTFLEQLKHGGPITITHKDVERFFMTIPEAVSLVLQASVIGKGGDILVLDMGDPVKILTLAEELIRIHGLQPYRDIDIQFIGLRAGEKLFEEPLSAEEGTNASKHKKIFIARQGKKYSRNEIEKTLRAFEKLLKVLPIMDNYEIIRDVLRNYVKSFERRGHNRQNQQLEYTDSELLQNDEAHVQNNKVQFEKFLNELPAIEDYEIIRATLRNYINILEKRRHNRISQKSEKVVTTPQRMELVRKDLQLVFGKKRCSLSFLDKPMEEEFKEQIHFSQHAMKDDYFFTIGYEDNGNTVKNGKSLYFKGEKWSYHSNGNGEIQVLLPKNQAFPDAVRILALLYNEFYKREDNSFILHAAGLQKHGKGFIFTGESGAGKTTLSKLSLPEAEVLSDESIIVSKDCEGYWISQCPLKTEITKLNDKRVKLCAIFLLVKDTTNSLKKISGAEIAHKLMDNIIYVNLSENVTWVNVLEEKLNLVSAVCEHVPVYELRFRKDNSFWEEIERAGVFETADSI